MKQLRHSLRSDAVSVTILLVASVLVWVPRLGGIIDLRWDGAVYYVLGTSIAQGRGYRLLYELGDIQAIQYPPLLPTLVALHQLALGTSDYHVVGQALRHSYAAIFFAYIVGVYVLARQTLSARLSLPIGLITGLFIWSVFTSDLLFAEIPFALATVVFFILHGQGGGSVRFAALSALGCIAYFLRLAGIALLAAWVIDAILGRRWRQVLLRSAVMLLPVLAWQSYIGEVKSEREYRQPAYPYQRASYQYHNVTYLENILLADPYIPGRGWLTPSLLAGRVLGNLAAMPDYMGEAITGGNRSRTDVLKKGFRLGVRPAWLGLIATTALGCLASAGLILRASRREWLLPAYVGTSVLIVSLTPWPEQVVRYLTPLTPFLVLALSQSLLAAGQFVERRRQGRWRQLAPVFVLGVLWLLVARNGFATVRILKTRNDARVAHAGRWEKGFEHLIFYDPAWDGFNQAIRWLDAHAGREGIVVSSTPQWVYLRSGRKAVMPPMESDTSRAQSLIDSVPAHYLIVDEMEHAAPVRHYLDGPVQAFPDLWEPVFRSEFGGAEVYHRRGDSRSVVSGPPGEVGETASPESKGSGDSGKVEPSRGAK